MSRSDLKFEGLDDDQLRSAVRNIGDPNSELRKEMIEEARLRYINSFDFRHTCPQPDAWYYFFKELEA